VEDTADVQHVDVSTHGAVVLAELETPAATALSMLPVAMLVSKICLISCKAAGLKTKSATRAAKLLPRVNLCKVRYKVTKMLENHGNPQQICCNDQVSSLTDMNKQREFKSRGVRRLLVCPSEPKN
jgi:hypothetical protein